MAILVAGGAGYIGSHTVLELLEMGEDVVVVDSLVKGHKQSVLGGKLYIGDLRDELFLEKVFDENEIEAVIHFAAYSLVGESVTNPLKYYENNMYSTCKLLQMMEKKKVDKIVFSSTAATYGDPENIPISENDKTFPTNPYGETKLSVEKMLKWCDNAFGLKYAVLRYFNAAGAHISGKIGEDHDPESHLIPLILKTALGIRPHISVFGTDYETGDGTCIRDYIHVTDLATAHILALKKLREDKKSVTYNLGNGKGFSVKEVIELSKEITGIDFKVEYVERRPGDPAILISSSEKIKNELKWKPKYNELNTIIETAWNWHKNNPKGFNK